VVDVSWNYRQPMIRIQEFAKIQIVTGWYLIEKRKDDQLLGSVSQKSEY
jgi:hypothetical protein